MGMTIGRRYALDPFGRLVARTIAGTTLVALTLSMAAGFVRVMPWLFAAPLEWRIAWPFFKSVTLLATETALLFGTIVGFMVATQRWIERGNHRTWQTLGCRPLQLLKGLILPMLAIGASLTALGYWSGSDAKAPGHVVKDLIAETRAACRDGEARAVPFVGASWICTKEGAWLVGQVPGQSTVFSARSIQFSDTLRDVGLDDVQLLLGKHEVRAGHVKVRGLPSWISVAKTNPWARGVLLFASAIAVCAGGGLVFLRAHAVRAWIPFAVGIAGSLLVLALLRTWDGRLILAGIPPIGALAGATLATILLRFGENKT